MAQKRARIQKGRTPPPEAHRLSPSAVMPAWAKPMREPKRFTDR